ncbi:MAG: NADP-dependent malic enzyme [Ruminococcaceae bacterium]|nr:NADP-dependent malic enzyme [Oscillospiraceae bacterium]
MNYAEESLKKHYEWKGKFEVAKRVAVDNKEALSLAYTPGVAAPCLEIQKDESKSYELTRRWNTVAVITDGTAVLGLGDIGPVAGMPVMEGKALLFKTFGDVDAIPICIKSKDVDELVRTIYLISGSFGGINLEDISAPRCFEVERRLKEICDIPVFHDDQHGTAIVLGAALLNAFKVVDKKIDDVKVVINGAGSAGTAIAKFLIQLGVKNLILCDKIGTLFEGKDGMTSAQTELASITNKEKFDGTLADAMRGSDVFIGVSAPGIVSEEMVASMNKGAIVFPMSNPTPEIDLALAIKAGAAVVGTGRSDFKNQINNLLAFPGIFRGALDARVKDITEEMKIAAAYAIASLISDEERCADYIIPSPFDERVGKSVAKAVYDCAVATGMARI